MGFLPPRHAEDSPAGAVLSSDVVFPRPRLLCTAADRFCRTVARCLSRQASTRIILADGTSSRSAKNLNDVLRQAVRRLPAPAYALHGPRHLCGTQRRRLSTRALAPRPATRGRGPAGTPAFTSFALHASPDPHAQPPRSPARRLRHLHSLFSACRSRTRGLGCCTTGLGSSRCTASCRTFCTFTPSRSSRGNGRRAGECGRAAAAPARA